MGICHPKPSPPKTPFDDDATLPDAPPEYSTEVRGPSRQDMIDRDHHDRLLAVATAAAALADGGGHMNPATNGGPTLTARDLCGYVTAIAMVRGRTGPCVNTDHLPSALPQMRVLFLAGDAVGKIVDAVLDMLLH